MIVIAIVTGVVLCVFTVCFFNYKENELEFKKKENEYALYIEKEHTEQRHGYGNHRTCHVCHGRYTGIRYRKQALR